MFLYYLETLVLKSHQTIKPSLLQAPPRGWNFTIGGGKPSNMSHNPEEHQVCQAETLL